MAPAGAGRLLSLSIALKYWIYVNLYMPTKRVGAVYPINGFPNWMRAISSVDPFTYDVHAFKELLLKNAGIGAIAFDLSFLIVFALLMMTFATLLFKRSL